MRFYFVCEKCGAKYCTESTQKWLKEKYRKAEAEGAPYGLCEDCAQAEAIERREKATSKAYAEATNMGLPELIGTEKQVGWALRIRYEMIQHLTYYVGEILKKTNRTIERVENEDKEGKEETILSLKKQIEWIYEARDLIYEQNTARWWIDNRLESVGEILHEYYTRVKQAPQQEPEQEAPKPKNDTITIKPQELTSKAAVKITLTEDTIVAAPTFYDADIAAIIKSKEYRYDSGIWTRKINFMAGNINDRATELANALLNAGIEVTVPKNIENAAVTADFAPENKRWVTEVDGKFAISWGYGNEMYKKANRIPTSKWSNGRMLVKAEMYNEVIDFAELNGFNISKGAHKFIDEAKAIEKEKHVVTPAQPTAEPNAKDKLSEILASSREVLSDLKDDTY